MAVRPTVAETASTLPRVLLAYHRISHPALGGPSASSWRRRARRARGLGRRAALAVLVLYLFLRRATAESSVRSLPASVVFTFCRHVPVRGEPQRARSSSSARDCDARRQLDHRLDDSPLPRSGPPFSFTATLRGARSLLRPTTPNPRSRRSTPPDRLRRTLAGTELPRISSETCRTRAATPLWPWP